MLPLLLIPLALVVLSSASRRPLPPGAPRLEWKDDEIAAAACAGAPVFRLRGTLQLHIAETVYPPAVHGIKWPPTTRDREVLELWDDLGDVAAQVLSDPGRCS